LNRLLALYGLELDPAGPLIEHHGQRQPYYVDLTRMLDRMRQKHTQFWELVTDYGKIQPTAGQSKWNSISESKHC
jgi:N-acyl amino acid synthase of PEP-CTERM/exosortase system